MFLLIGFSQIALGRSAEQEHCIVELPVSDDIVPGQYGFSRFSRAVIVPGFQYPFIDLEASKVATIVDGKLVPFSLPPLDQSNSAMPELISQEDGTILAYNRVDRRFYALTPNSEAFRPLDLKGIEEIQNAIAYASLPALTQHSEASHGAPRLYGFRNEPLKQLVHITHSAISPVEMPEMWRHIEFPPAFIPGIGYFAEAQGAMMFRRGEDTEWAEISRYANVIGLMANRPMQTLYAHLSNDGTFFLRLSDRVLVGRISEAEDRPDIVYQAAGKQVFHEPTGQVLVFPDEPYGVKWARNRPRLARMEAVLHELRSGSPMIPNGDQIGQQMLGTVPFHQWIYHPESERTLIAHRLGVASFDGDKVADLAEFSQFSKYMKTFDRVGPKIIMHAIGSGYYEITAELKPREIAVPEKSGSIAIEYSAVLNRYIASSSSWSTVYLSHDLERFYPVNGAVEGVVRYAGDFGGDGSAVLVARGGVYSVQMCAP